MNRLVIAWKAVLQLGIQQVGLYGLYKLGLMTGHYRRITMKPARSEWKGAINPLFEFPSQSDLLAVIGKEGKSALLTEADEIVNGQIRLFGGESVTLRLTVPGPMQHWTDYETGRIPFPKDGLPFPDIKFLWEPARFGWAFILGRAYHLTGEEKFSETFWKNFESFIETNPHYLGPHWMSGQEVALRLLALIWSGQIFEKARASSPERMQKLSASIAAHATRIPPTLIYARSQHNNHVLTEALGLLSAGLALPEHPNASRWRILGWRWLNAGLQSQIDSYGEYAQHSTNYHRLMLQVVLWANSLFRKHDLRWPRQTLEAIRRSVHWLLSLMDSESGQVPNLGANDGAYIFPLSTSPFEDYRPLLHAAARAFLDYNLPNGSWDEMALWVGEYSGGFKTLELPRYIGDQLYGQKSWAYLRTAQFRSRPSHADQLHLDLWWRGLNVARDAGTYLYNTPPPWDNSFARAQIHNTVTVNGQDQMVRAGRFLYLDWVNAYRKPIPVSEMNEVQRTRGRYRGNGYRHTRIVSVQEEDRWQVVDEILSLSMPWQKKRIITRLQWLLPDWEWQLEPDEQGIKLRLLSPHGPFILSIRHSPNMARSSFSLVRGSELLSGSADPDPTRGWTSPTYGIKIPALSFALVVEAKYEVTFTSEFTFPTSG